MKIVVLTGGAGRVAVIALALCACGAPIAPSAGGPRTLLSYGDNQPQSVLAFPDVSYEALIRFDVPQGGVPPVRLWYRPASPGGLQITFYESSRLDGPGRPLWETRRDVPPEASGPAASGRWITEELGDAPLKGQDILWVGFRKLAESPGLWCSDKDAGHYYMRSSDPARHVALVPVRRTPLVQLEFVPAR
jgi:hypothetical protein